MNLHNINIYRSVEYFHLYFCGEGQQIDRKMLEQYLGTICPLNFAAGQIYDDIVKISYESNFDRQVVFYAVLIEKQESLR